MAIGSLTSQNASSILTEMAVTILRILREERGETQRETAAILGLSVATYSPVERGDLRPSPRIARALEERFGRPVDVLLRPPRVPVARQAAS